MDDMVPHSWNVEMLEKIKVADNMKGLLCGSTSDWKTDVKKLMGKCWVKWGLNRKYSRGTPCFHCCFLLQ